MNPSGLPGCRQQHKKDEATPKGIKEHQERWNQLAHLLRPLENQQAIQLIQT